MCSQSLWSWSVSSTNEALCFVPFCSESGDARVLPVLRALTAFFEGQDNVTAGYTLEGRHLANFSHLSFTAPVCCLLKVGGSRIQIRVQGLVRSRWRGATSPTSATCPSPGPRVLPAQGEQASAAPTSRAACPVTRAFAMCGRPASSEDSPWAVAPPQLVNSLPASIQHCSRRSRLCTLGYVHGVTFQPAAAKVTSGPLRLASCAPHY